MTKDQENGTITLEELESRVEALEKENDHFRQLLYTYLREVAIILLGRLEDAGGLKRSIPPRKKRN